MTGHEHGAGCHMAAAVRFSKPGVVPPVAALASTAVNAVLAQSKQRRCAPDDVINVAVGPGGLLAGLWEKLIEPGADGPASVAAVDQVAATFKAEPRRFAALAFGHVSPDPTL